MADIEINGIKVKPGIKINIYSNTKALGIPKGYYKIKRIYKDGSIQYIELQNSMGHYVVGKITILEMVKFKRV